MEFLEENHRRKVKYKSVMNQIAVAGILALLCIMLVGVLKFSMTAFKEWYGLHYMGKSVLWEVPKDSMTEE